MPNKAVALALSTHPGPAVAVTAIAAILGIGIGLDPGRVVLLAAAVLANQASVGLSNDWIDAERDRLVGRRDKPIARGWVSPSAVAAIALTVPLGMLATAVHVLFIASAWAYNAGLKNTVLSVLPYVVSFGILPLLVTLALPVPAGAAWWAMAVGAMLGIAAHIANVLPDLDDDRRTGIRGMPHRLGRRTAGLVTYLALASASLLVVLGPLSRPSPVQWAGLALGLIVSAAGVVIALTRPPTRLLFRLIIAAAIIDVALLALAGTLILA
jgi:4-hydroxybenzoate polyprenyltransferase